MVPHYLSMVLVYITNTMDNPIGFLKFALTHYVFSIVHSFMKLFDTKQLGGFMNFMNGSNDEEDIVDSVADNDEP